MSRKINYVLIILVISSVFSLYTLVPHVPCLTWQLSLLFNPGDHQYEMERRGRVFIYDLSVECFSRCLFSYQYDRIEGMMFVNTVVTDDNGVPLTDPETGELLVENDGCD